MDSINYDLMRHRIEFLFRMIGKVQSSENMPGEVIKRISNLTAQNGIDIIFLHRNHETIDLSPREAKTRTAFGEIIVRHLNNTRNRLLELPAMPMNVTIANIEIVIREGIDTAMIEVKAFFEREDEKKNRIVKTLNDN